MLHVTEIEKNLCVKKNKYIFQDEGLKKTLEKHNYPSL
jgi:hypothetical protein